MLQWLFVESSQSVTRNTAGIGLSEVQPRKALHTLFKTDARIVCDRAKGLLNVRILGLRSNGTDEP